MDQIKKLQAAASKEEAAELTVAYNGKITAMRAYQERPGKTAKENLAAARDELEETIQRLNKKYFGGQPDHLPNIPAAHAWLIENGYDITERSVRNHAKAGMLPAERTRNGKIKQIRIKDLDRYARQHLERTDAPSDDKARLLKAQADKLEIENDIKRGRYLDRAEEEQRDAAILASFRQHLERSAPDRLQSLLAEVGQHIDATARAKINALQPQWLQRDLDSLAGMFDSFQGAG